MSGERPPNYAQIKASKPKASKARPKASKIRQKQSRIKITGTNMVKKERPRGLKKAEDGQIQGGS